MPLSHSFDCIGVLARTVGDCARLLSVMAGADERDGMSSRHIVSDYERGLDEATRPHSLAGVTVGVPNHYYYDGVDQETAEALVASRAILEARGAKIADVPIGDHSAINDLAAAILSPEAAALHLPWLRERPQDYAKQTRARLLVGLGIPVSLYLQAMQARSRLLEELLRETFTKCDVLHVPVLKRQVPTAAATDVGASATMAQVLADIVACTRPLNFFSLPGLVVPIGLARNGLPLAMQLIGRPFRRGLAVSRWRRLRGGGRGRRGATAALVAPVEHDLFGTPVSVPDQMRGRLFPDRAPAQPGVVAQETRRPGDPRPARGVSTSRAILAWVLAYWPP